MSTYKKENFILCTSTCVYDFRFKIAHSNNFFVFFILEAGNAFMQSASLNLNEKMENKHTAGTNYVDAANCFRKCDPNSKNRFLII